MKVIISAAGTGGHIYPAISIINKIKEENKDCSFIYIGTTDRMEKDIIPKLGIKYIGLDVKGFSKNVFKTVKAFNLMLKARKKCLEIMKEFKPDIVIGVGGYVTVPVILAAHKLKIKTLIHEQNSIPGKANIFISKYVDRICVSMKSSEKYFDKNKTVYTGNPRAEEVLKNKKHTKKELGFDEKKKLVLITMGSLGSKTVNKTVGDALRKVKNKPYDILFVTGESYYEDYKDIKSSNVKVVKYLNNMPDVLQVTDLIISRSGATIASEIMALGVVSILIPSPYVPNNHQYLNAMEFVNNNATVLINESELTEDKLLKEIDNIFSDNKHYEEMKENTKKLATPHSLTDIYKEIERLVK